MAAQRWALLWTVWAVWTEATGGELQQRACVCVCVNGGQSGGERERETEVYGRITCNKISSLVHSPQYVFRWLCFTIYEDFQLTKKVILSAENVLIDVWCYCHILSSQRDILTF